MYYIVFSYYNSIFRYHSPCSIRSETVYGNEQWEKEKWEDAAIARIYDGFPISGWVISDPRLAKLGRLAYEEDEDQYQKQAHVYCVQLASDAINVLDRLV